MPIRALARARDLYIRSMNNYADKVSYSYGGYGSGPSYADPLPRSFSTTSTRSRDNDEDFNELIRAASTSKLSTRIDLNHPAFSSSSSGINNNNNNNNNIGSNNNKLRKGMVPRSASVGMAKIEEDKPIEFDEIVGNNNIKNDDIKMNKNGSKKEKFRFFPRSKTYAFGRSTNKIS